MTECEKNVRRSIAAVCTVYKKKKERIDQAREKTGSQTKITQSAKLLSPNGAMHGWEEGEEGKERGVV